MIGYFKKRHEAKERAIAKEVIRQLEASGRGWEKFLPPVQMDGAVYMVTENGSIYKMYDDPVRGYEIITQIRSG